MTRPPNSTSSTLPAPAPDRPLSIPELRAEIDKMRGMLGKPAISATSDPRLLLATLATLRRELAEMQARTAAKIANRQLRSDLSRKTRP